MPRWDPGTEQRLARAALDLFSARGYDDVTITEIAERAGITRRSYFRYFPDKREVLFAGSDRLPPAVADAVLAVDEQVDASSAAVQAISDVGAQLVERIERAAERRAAIEASPELQERDRTKRATVAAAIDAALRRRGVAAAEASLVAGLAAVVFEHAFADWVAAGGRRTFPECTQAVAATVRSAVAAGVTAARTRGG